MRMHEGALAHPRVARGRWQVHGGPLACNSENPPGGRFIFLPRCRGVQGGPFPRWGVTRPGLLCGIFFFVRRTASGA